MVKYPRVKVERGIYYVYDEAECKYVPKHDMRPSSHVLRDLKNRTGIYHTPLRSTKWDWLWCLITAAFLIYTLN